MIFFTFIIQAVAVILFVCFHGLADVWGSSGKSSPSKSSSSESSPSKSSSSESSPSKSSSSSSKSSSVSGIECDNKHTYFNKEQRCLEVSNMLPTPNVLLVFTSLDWLQSLKQLFINVSHHILVASLTLMALFSKQGHQSRTGYKYMI